MSKKTAIISVITSAVLFWMGSAVAGNIVMDEEVFKKIYTRQNALEKRIYELEHSDTKDKDQPKKTGGESPNTSENTEIIQEHQDDLEEIFNRLDTIETRSILDKIQFTGSLRTRYDSFKIKDINQQSRLGPTGETYDGETTETWSNRFRLNLKSDITKNIVFHGRLSSFKLWGDHNFTETNLFDGNYSANPVARDLYVERAYIDYFIPKTPISITFGRVPTTGGPPTELRDNSTRKATWPKLVTSTEADGILFNLNLDQFVGLKNGMFRLVYNKNLQDSMKASSEKDDRVDDTRSLTTVFEMAIPRFRDSVFWLSYMQIWDLRNPPEAVLPEYVSIIDQPRNSGDFGRFSIHLQFNNFLNSNFDIFAAYSHDDIHPNEDPTTLRITYDDTTGAYFDYPVGLYSDALNGNLGKHLTADGIYAGFRYTFPFESLNYPKFGFEYNYGGEHFLGNILISEGGEILNKLGAHGHAYEAYYIQPINKKHMFLRFGAIYIEHEYVNPYLFFGTQPESDQTTLNIYSIAEVRF